ncbi:uncharacterized protein LOC128271176 [Anopheles cruzii]|uniref:uncharacterized protein LOC128271176 n=1 Tax=Anopheles cruzii TaxID=68878 RepID=UPI0022EC4947|nr:uncharacterized protein LOC128271176 [Anopheles cruzii]
MCNDRTFSATTGNTAVSEGPKMGHTDKPDATGRRRRRPQTSQTTQCWPPGLALLLGLLLSASIVQTGPVIRSRRMIREIYVENSPSASVAAPEGASVEASGDGGDSSPAADFVASDMCLHDGAYVERSAISCEKKHGCRAIQKTGECCADFQCECQRDGKTYANGEKLLDPNTPCRSCYCQGGEVTCNEVSCYKRNDCDPKYIPGRCCPEYDNCPPLEHFKLTESGSPKEGAGVAGGQETNEVNGSHAAEPPLAASEATDLAAGHQKIQQSQPQEQQQQASASSSTAAPVTTTGPTAATATAMSNDNPLGIKIKEITKPEEIRLTDNRPAPAPEPTPSQSEELVNLEHLDVNVPDDDGGNGTKIVRHTPDGDSMRSELDGPREEPPKSTSAENRVESYESSTGGTVSESDEWLDVKEQSESSAWSTTPSASVSSTTAPPPAPSTSDPAPDRNEDSGMKPAKPSDNGLPAVVQIGDKLVIVDHNQPKPITVIQVEEVEGLQRGEDDNVYDQEMYTERSPAATETGRESSKKLKLHQPADPEQETLSTQADSSGSYETVWHGGSTEVVGVSSEEVYDTQLYTEGPEDAASNDTNTSKSSEQDTVSKEDFLHMNPSQEPAKIVKAEQTTTSSSSEGPSYGSSEEGSTSLADLSTSLGPDASGDGMIFETQFYTEGPGTSSEEVKWQGATEDPTVNETSTAASFPTRDPVPVADDLVTHGKTYIEDDEHDLIQPGFQPLPEDFSLPQRDQPSHDMMMPDEMEHGSGAKQEKILSEVLELTRKNATTTTGRPDEAVGSSAEEVSPAVVESGSTEETSNSPAWLKEDPKPQSRAPGEPHLVPEWERSNATAGNNSSSASEEQELESGSGEHASGALKVGSEEEVEGSGEESSTTAATEVMATSAAPLKAGGHSEREEDGDEQDKLEVGSASARSALDIDAAPATATTANEQSDSVKHNPKNDVESLKYDENENDATADEAIPKKVQQLEVSVLEAFRGLPSPTLTSV